MNGPVRKCRVCGCTDFRACIGGCWWVSEDVCSACVAPRAVGEAVTAEVIGTVRHHIDGPYLDYVVEGGLADFPEDTAVYIIHPLEAPNDGVIELFTAPAVQPDAPTEQRSTAAFAEQFRACVSAIEDSEQPLAGACAMLLIDRAFSTNAGQIRLEVEGVVGKDGNDWGDWVVTVQRKCDVTPEVSHAQGSSPE